MLALLPACGTAGPLPAPATDNLAPGPGVAVVRSRCTACHPASMFTTRHASARQWSATLDQMIARGAQVSDADYAVILAYLTRHYGEN